MTLLPEGESLLDAALDVRHFDESIAAAEDTGGKDEWMLRV